ncbi:MAG: tetratricopeptide repeat protein [Rubricella sp.]
MILAALAVASATVDVAAQDRAEDLDALFAELSDPELADPGRVERRIERIWTRSGSDTVDFLLERGRQALEAGEYLSAVEHLTAATDHAPGFAEGWNLRATAFYLMEEYALSLADIRRTLALEPRHFGALAGLGLIMEELGRPEDAWAAYRAAQTLNPHQMNVNAAVERLELIGIGEAI